MLAHCWPIVCDAGPTVSQHWVIVSYLLGKPHPGHQHIYTSQPMLHVFGGVQITIATHQQKCQMWRSALTLLPPPYPNTACHSVYRESLSAVRFHGNIMFFPVYTRQNKILRAASVTELACSASDMCSKSFESRVPFNTEHIKLVPPSKIWFYSIILNPLREFHLELVKGYRAEPGKLNMHKHSNLCSKARSDHLIDICEYDKMRIY